MILFLCLIVCVNSLLQGNTLILVNQFKNQTEIFAATRGRYLTNYIHLWNAENDFNFKFEIDKRINMNQEVDEIIDENHYPLPQLFNLAVIKIKLNFVFKNDYNVGIGYGKNNSMVEYYNYRHSYIASSDPYYSFYYIEMLEFLSPYGLIIALLILPLIFTLVFIFRNDQPLMSRNYLPLVHIICQHTFLFAGIPTFIVPLEYFKYNCLLVWIFQYSMILVIVTLTLLHFWRYLLLLKLQKLRQNCLFELNPKINNSFKFIKYLSRWYVNVAISILSYIVYCVIFLTVFIISDFKCAGDINRYIYNSIILLLSSLGVISLICDGIFNGNKMCKNKDKLFKFLCSNTLLYRLESHTFIICGFIMYIITLPFGYITGFGGTLGSSIRNSFLCWYIFFAQVLFPLTLTIYYKLRLKFRKKTECALTSLFKSDRFEAFCRKEMNDENIQCFKDIHEYKNEDFVYSRITLAAKISEKYLHGNDSSHEIIAKQDTIEYINENIKNKRFDSNLFEELEKEIIKNMMDPVSRYLLSQEHKDEIEYSKFSEECLGKTTNL